MKKQKHKYKLNWVLKKSKDEWALYFENTNFICTYKDELCILPQITLDIFRPICLFYISKLTWENIYVDTASIQFSWVAQSCPTLHYPMDCSMPGLPMHHQLKEFTQTHVHWVSDATQPSHPLSSPSLHTFKLSQHQSLFKWGSSSHQVAKVLELQLQHQSLQWTLRTGHL